MVQKDFKVLDYCVTSTMKSNVSVYCKATSIIFTVNHPFCGNLYSSSAKTKPEWLYFWGLI